MIAKNGSEENMRSVTRDLFGEPELEIAEGLDAEVAEQLESSSTHTSSTSTSPKREYKPRKQYKLDLSSINTDPSQPRKEFDEVDLHELAESIGKYGVLQPVLFTEKDDGKIVLVCGERRFQASIIAKKETIPGIYITGDDTAEIALVENLLRVDLTPIEEAEALKRLQDEKKYSNVELAAVIGKSQSSMSEILKLNKLPQELRDKYRGDRTVSRRKWLEVAKSDDPKEIMKQFKKLLNNATRDELRTARAKSTKKPEEVLKTAIDRLTALLKSVNLKELELENRNFLVENLEFLVLEINNKVNEFKQLS